MSWPRALDQLQQVHELNRAFLSLLQTRLRQQRMCLGLPLGAWPAVMTASQGLLDAAAVVPRSLFRIALDARAPSGEASADFDDIERQLCLSVLLGARATSRHSAYQARLLFGLDTVDVERLAGASLPDVHRLAAVPGMLACALCEPQWFWPWLLTMTRPEVRLKLTLLALQPRVGDWPVRRAPHVTV